MQLINELDVVVKGHLPNAKSRGDHKSAQSWEFPCELS